MIVVAARTDGTLLEPLLETILVTLLDSICILPDYAQPELLRTHSETLRCYECLALHFTDHTMDHLLTQLKNNSEKERVKSLLVLTHLTNSIDSAIKTRIKDVLANLMVITHDNSLKVKRALLKTIVALAYKGMIIHEDIQHERFVEFIIKLSQLQSTVKETVLNELTDLRSAADNALFMLCTSVPDLETILWHLLAKCFLSPEYIGAQMIILRCLTHLASKAKYKEYGDGIFVRCLVMLACPVNEFRGTYVLNFLRHTTMFEKEATKSVWTLKTTQLLKYLESNYDVLNEKEWELMLLDILNDLIKMEDDEGLSLTLVTKMREQLAFFSVR